MTPDTGPGPVQAPQHPGRSGQGERGRQAGQPGPVHGYQGAPQVRRVRQRRRIGNPRYQNVLNDPLRETSTA